MWHVAPDLRISSHSDNAGSLAPHWLWAGGRGERSSPAESPDKEMFKLGARIVWPCGMWRISGPRPTPTMQAAPHWLGGVGRGERSSSVESQDKEMFKLGARIVWPCGMWRISGPRPTPTMQAAPHWLRGVGRGGEVVISGEPR